MLNVRFLFFSLRLQNETKSLMQQTNGALQQLKDIRVSTEADQVRKSKIEEFVGFFFDISFVLLREKNERWPKVYRNST